MCTDPGKKNPPKRGKSEVPSLARRVVCAHTIHEDDGEISHRWTDSPRRARRVDLELEGGAWHRDLLSVEANPDVRESDPDDGAGSTCTGDSITRTFQPVTARPARHPKCHAPQLCYIVRQRHKVHQHVDNDHPPRR